MLTTIQQLKKNHQNFDVIWNKIGTAVQEDLVKTAPELLTALGAWYNRSNELIFELEDQIEQNALLDSAEDIEEEDEDEEFDDFDEEIDEPQNDDHNSPRPGIAVNL